MIDNCTSKKMKMNRGCMYPRDGMEASCGGNKHPGLDTYMLSKVWSSGGGMDCTAALIHSHPTAAVLTHNNSHPRAMHNPSPLTIIGSLGRNDG